MIAIVPVTAMPYAAPSALDDLKPTRARGMPTIERLVDLGDVDLPGLVLGRVDDRHARRVAELHACCVSENAPEISACDAMIAASVAMTSSG